MKHKGLAANGKWLTYRFHGYKTVTYADVLPSDASCSCNYLYEIFEWCCFMVVASSARVTGQSISKTPAAVTPLPKK